MNPPRLINNGAAGNITTSRRNIIIVILILVVIVISIGIYIYFRKPKVTKKDNFHASVPNFNNVKLPNNNNVKSLPNGIINNSPESKYGQELLPGDDVKLLNGEGNMKQAVVLFFSKNCGHCTTFGPEFAMASLKNTGIPMYVVDAAKFPNLLSHFKIEGVPTVLLIKNGSIADTYRGDRKAASVLQFSMNSNLNSNMNSHAKISMQPPAQIPQPREIGVLSYQLEQQQQQQREGLEMEDGEEANLLGGKGRFSQKITVMFYGDHCSHCKQTDPEYTRAALTSNGRLIKINASKFPKLLQHFHISGVPTIVQIQNGNIVKTFEGPRTAQRFEEFGRV